jgi:hypothetical protein
MGVTSWAGTATDLKGDGKLLLMSFNMHMSHATMKHMSVILFWWFGLYTKWYRINIICRKRVFWGEINVCFSENHVKLEMKKNSVTGSQNFII